MTTIELKPQMGAFVKAIQKAGGEAFLVGGAVISVIQGEPENVKDWDIEVFCLTLDQLKEVIVSENLSVNEVGTSFGVLISKMDGLDIDISLPRTESKVGEGHKGFDVKPDPFLSTREASKRRDLTINSIMCNLHTMEIVDAWGGVKDLKNGCLRFVDRQTFKDDPLRVMRIMQLLPRKGKFVRISTTELCQDIKDKFSELSKERLFGEFEKLLMKSEKPSMGLEFLRQSEWLGHFPELFDLIDCPQNPIHHPEGDVWIHTLMVVDNAAKLRHLIPEELQLTFMFAALLHDVGKPSTTDPETLTAHGHDKAGGPIAKAFMKRLTNETQIIKDVVTLVECHMRPGFLTKGNAGKSGWRRLSNQFRLDVLGYLTKADSAGRTGRDLSDLNPAFELCIQNFEKLGDKPLKRLVEGRDFMELGYKPGPILGTLVGAAYEIQLDGQDNKAILIQEAIKSIL